MWYFTWVLGVGFACTFAIINAMWLEAHLQNEADERGSNPVRRS